MESVDVSRGPGSVAYGSDAFGGVISVRTRRVAPGSPLVGQLQRHHRHRHSGNARCRRNLERPGRRRRAVRRAHARHGRLGEPPRDRGVQLGLPGSRIPRPLRAQGRPRHLLGRVAERLRPRDRAPAQQLADGAVLLSDGRLASLHDRLRSQQRRGLPAGQLHGLHRDVRSADGSGSVRDGHDRPHDRARGYFRERLPRARRGLAPVRQGAARDRHRRQRPLSTCTPSTISSPTTWPASLVSDRPNVSIDTARRTDTGVFASIDTALGSVFSIGAGIRGDYVTTSNEGGYFGDRSTATAPAPVTRQPRSAARGLQPDRPGRARLPRSGAVGSLLSRTDGTRLHHRQSRSRARDQPPGRRRGPLHGAGASASPRSTITTTSRT